MFASMSMNNTALDYLTHRFVLFSVEGTAEGAVIQTLYDNDLLVVPRDYVVMDNTYFDRPYTRLRKADKIADEYFGMSYESRDASGLTVARIVDSKSAKFEFPKRRQNGTEVLSFFTRPEIEMLVIQAEHAYGEWQKASRKNRQLKPSEFCSCNLGFSRLKEASFLKEYWSDAPKLVEAIQKHSEKAQRSKGELLLVDLLA